MQNDEAFVAAKEGNIEKLKELLGQGDINVDIKDIDDKTLLHYAATDGQHEMVRYLLENNADVLKTDDNDNYTALHIAVTRSDKATTSVIVDNVKRGILCELFDATITTNGNTALHIAVENDDYTHVTLLLKYGAIFDLQNDDDKVPMDLAKSEKIRGLFELITACFANATRNDRTLIVNLRQCIIFEDFTSAVNCRNSERWTIMQELMSKMDEQKLTFELFGLRMKYYARHERANGIVKYDLEHKNEIVALIKLIEQYQLSWLKYSKVAHSYYKRRQSNDDDASLESDVFYDELKKFCCKTMIMGHKILLGYRTFTKEIVIADPRIKIIEEIFELFEFDIQQIDMIDGDDPCYFDMLPVAWKFEIDSLLVVVDNLLHDSIEKFADRLECQLLYLNGSLPESVDVKDSDGNTMIHHAIRKRHDETLMYLLKNGVDPFQINKKSYTILHESVEYGNERTTKVILDNADRSSLPKLLNQKTKILGLTPLHIAAKYEKYNQAWLLLYYGANFESINYAGVTPLMSCADNKLSNLLDLITTLFENARGGDHIGLISEMKTCSVEDLMSAVRCRNSDNKTILQEVIMKEGSTVALKELFDVETNRLIMERDFDIKYSSTCGMKMIKLLSSIVEQVILYWTENSSVGMTRINSAFYQIAIVEQDGLLMCNDIIPDICCHTLSLASKALIAYWDFEKEWSMSLITSQQMRNVQELLELVGFNGEDDFEISSDEIRYSNTESAKWQHELIYLITVATQIFSNLTLFALRLKNIKDRDSMSPTQVVSEDPLSADE